MDEIFKALGKEYRKMGGKAMPAEIDIVGGAAIIRRYGFRTASSDIDAIIHAASAIKDAANKVGDQFGLPNGWLNSDFMHTSSYSDKLPLYTNPYRTFANVLTVRIVKPEYLAAMKLRSMRPYKNDISDLVGIIASEQESGTGFQKETIISAYHNLYDEDPSEEKVRFLDAVYSTPDLPGLYLQITGQEADNKDILKTFEEKYPGKLNDNNVSDILEHQKKKKDIPPQQ